MIYFLKNEWYPYKVTKGKEFILMEEWLKDLDPYIREVIEKEQKIEKMFGKRFRIEYELWSSMYGEGKLQKFPEEYLKSRKRRVYELLDTVKDQCQSTEDIAFWEELHNIEDWG